MTNTMTYAMALDTAINFLNENIQYGDDFSATVEKLTALKEQLAKRSTSKAPTKTQKANEEVKTLILNVLTDTGEKMTITEMLTDDRLKGFTNQKISALLRQMIESGKATKTIENKKAYFKATVE